MESEKLLLNTVSASTARHVSSFPKPIDILPPPSSSSSSSQKPSPPILDKFRALLKQKEEKARVSDDDAPEAVLSGDDVVEIYELVLNELTFNSKPIITDLTIIAGEHRNHAQGIADVICARIIRVPVEQKLPSLYLLDSIVKNIGREYVRCFSLRLPEVFCEAYKQVHPNLYASMRHLFGTWSTVFPAPVLRRIEVQLQFSPQVNVSNSNGQSSGLNSLRSSESPRPSHGIHVNPKYLRQLEHSGADNVGAQGLNTTSSGSHTSFTLGVNKFHTSSSTRLSRQLSPSGVGAERPLSSEVDDLATGNSPQRFIEGSSPSRPLFDYGHGRPFARAVDTNDWRRKQYSDESNNRFEASIAYGFGNGHEHRSPRALIDAYGDDRGKRIPNNKPLQIERLDVNGTLNKVASRSWQNTEEEEFDWEDMSPTLVDRGRSDDFLLSSAPPSGSLGIRPGSGRINALQLESDIWSNRPSQTQLSLIDDSSNITEDAIPILDSARGSMGKVPGYQTDRNLIIGSRHPPESWSLPHHLPQSAHLLNAKARGQNFQRPFSGIGKSSLSGVVPSSTGAWPPVHVHKSHPPPTNSMFPPQKQSRSQFDPVSASNAIITHGLHKGSFMPEQHLNSLEGKELCLMRQPSLLDQRASPNQQSQAQINPIQPQLFMSHEARESFPPSVLPPHSLGSHLNQGYPTQGHNTTISMVPPNTIPLMQLPLPVNNVPNTLNQVGVRPPLPPGPRPVSQMITVPQNAGPVGSNQPPGAFSGLISSLMAQGFLSLPNQSNVQDTVGLEFNSDLLKVRYESAIRALYADLPRQCTTCGLRFKSQEEHSSHMDWHVTKNRMSKNRKQKSSRKWFVSASMWLSGAEALGTDAVPGFLPSETVVEMKDDEEMAVPADEEQNTCALCGEPFDDFYSDETEEWMYKGAVYMNAASGSTSGMDRSQLGPIVHAKCRSESSVVPLEGSGCDDGGFNEEGTHRKKMRS